MRVKLSLGTGSYIVLTAKVYVRNILECHSVFSNWKSSENEVMALSTRSSGYLHCMLRLHVIILIASSPATVRSRSEMKLLDLVEQSRAVFCAHESIVRSILVQIPKLQAGVVPFRLLWKVPGEQS